MIKIKKYPGVEAIKSPWKSKGRGLLEPKNLEGSIKSWKFQGNFKGVGQIR